MAWHEAAEPRPKYLFKLKLTSGVKKAIAKIDWPAWEGQPTVGLEQTAETTVQLQGWSQPRRIVVARTLRPVNAGPQDTFWDLADEQWAVYVTNMSVEEASQTQVVACYRQRADCENVFDELKNQWGFAGFCSSKASVSECAARMQLLIYNLWSLFVRVLHNRDGHTEAVSSRYEFLLLPGRLVNSARQRCLKLSVSASVKKLLKAAYERLNRWLASTAPQLELNRGSPTPWTLFLPQMIPPKGES